MIASRLPYYELAPNLTAAMRGVVAQLEKSTLGLPLIELVYMRVSQMNGCAFCLEKHGKSLRAAGETNPRMDTLAGWHESRHFNQRERAALAWAESLTDIAGSHAPDEVYEPLKEFFTDVEITELTFAIANMNALNRLVISMRR